MLQVAKTIYDKAEENDGRRLLVMTFWPRGVKRETVHEWYKGAGTSPLLIEEWKSGRLSWSKFRERYRFEMRSPERITLVRDLANRAKRETLTLLCSCRDAHRCHRTLLKELIEEVS